MPPTVPEPPDYTFRIRAEPRAEDAPCDYAALYAIISDRLQTQRGRIDKIDAKSGTILAALLVVIGFSIGHIRLWYEIGILALYLVPLYYLFQAYKAISWDDAPSPVEFAAKNPRYPMTSLATAIGSMVNECLANSARLRRKAERLNRGYLSAIVVAGIAVCVHIAAQIQTGALDVTGFAGAPPPTSSAAPRVSTP